MGLLAYLVILSIYFYSFILLLNASCFYVEERSPKFPFQSCCPFVSMLNVSAAVNSVFKYDNPPPPPPSQAIKSPITNNLWKPTINSPSMSSESTVSSPTASKLPFLSRKVDDVGAKSMITSSTANVVSISVKAPVSNRIYSNCESDVWYQGSNNGREKDRVLKYLQLIGTS